jgi:uncharacterized RDD family membrane protein YckC
VSTVPREARPYQGQRAGVVTRLLAAVVDGVVVAAMLGALYGAYALLLFLWDPAAFHLPRVSREVTVPAAGALVTAYLAYWWATTGRSYGAHVLGLRVVTTGRARAGTGAGPPGVVRSLVRAVLCVLFPVGLLWAGVSPAQRSVQDLLVRTSVVYDWAERPRRAPHR